MIIHSLLIIVLSEGSARSLELRRNDGQPTNRLWPWPWPCHCTYLAPNPIQPDESKEKKKHGGTHKTEPHTWSKDESAKRARGQASWTQERQHEIRNLRNDHERFCNRRLSREGSSVFWREAERWEGSSKNRRRNDWCLISKRRSEVKTISFEVNTKL